MRSLPPIESGDKTRVGRLPWHDHRSHSKKTLAVTGVIDNRKSNFNTLHNMANWETGHRASAEMDKALPFQKFQEFDAVAPMPQRKQRKGGRQRDSLGFYLEEEEAQLPQMTPAQRLDQKLNRLSQYCNGVRLSNMGDISRDSAVEYVHAVSDAHRKMSVANANGRRNGQMMTMHEYHKDFHYNHALSHKRDDHSQDTAKRSRLAELHTIKSTHGHLPHLPHLRKRSS